MTKPHCPRPPVPSPLPAASPPQGPRPANCVVIPQTVEKAEEVAPPTPRLAAQPGSHPSAVCVRPTFPRHPSPRRALPHPPALHSLPGPPTRATCPVPGPQSVTCWASGVTTQRRDTSRVSLPTSGPGAPGGFTPLLDPHPPGRAPTRAGLPRAEGRCRHRRPRTRSLAAVDPAPSSAVLPQMPRHVHVRPEEARGRGGRARPRISAARPRSRRETP